MENVIYDRIGITKRPFSTKKRGYCEMYKLNIPNKVISIDTESIKFKSSINEMIAEKNNKISTGAEGFKEVYRRTVDSLIELWHKFVDGCRALIRRIVNFFLKRKEDTVRSHYEEVMSVLKKSGKHDNNVKQQVNGKNQLLLGNNPKVVTIIGKESVINLLKYTRLKKYSYGGLEKSDIGQATNKCMLALDSVNRFTKRVIKFASNIIDDTVVKISLNSTYSKLKDVILIEQKEAYDSLEKIMQKLKTEEKIEYKVREKDFKDVQFHMKSIMETLFLRFLSIKESLEDLEKTLTKSKSIFDNLKKKEASEELPEGYEKIYPVIQKIQVEIVDNIKNTTSKLSELLAIVDIRTEINESIKNAYTN